MIKLYFNRDFHILDKYPYIVKIFIDFENEDFKIFFSNNVNNALLISSRESWFSSKKVSVNVTNFEDYNPYEKYWNFQENTIWDSNKGFNQCLTFRFPNKEQAESFENKAEKQLKKHFDLLKNEFLKRQNDKWVS